MIEWGRVRREIVTRGVQGLNQVGEYALDRAKFHAPVRQIFDARTNRRGMPWHGNRQHWNQADYARFRKSRRNYRRVGEVLGHIGTDQPVFYQPKTRRAITGDFRRFDSTTGRLATVARQESIGGRGARALRSASANRRLNRAGRSELKRARELGEETRTPFSRQRAGVRTRDVSALYKGRIGGRLKGEIYLVKASYPASTGGTVWVYVVAPTEYAKYQEYGAHHHRAQPFLRPALYEARSQMRLIGRKIEMPSAKPITFARAA